jgi:hypothetical protein
LNRVARRTSSGGLFHARDGINELLGFPAIRILLQSRNDEENGGFLRLRRLEGR